MSKESKEFRAEMHRQKQKYDKKAAKTYHERERYKEKQRLKEQENVTDEERS